MEIYKGMRLRQVLENNGVDVEVLSEYNAYFCVPTTKTAYAIIERWCEENNIHIAEVISAVKIVHNGNEDMFYLCNDIRLDKKTTLPVPTRSPWGRVKTVHTLCKGAYEVDTAIHGGIMIAEKMKDNYLAKYAQGMAVKWGSFLCYEKDSMASIALCELLDRKLIKCTPGFCGTPENFEKYIDEKVQQEHPEYAIFRANMMAYGKYVFKPGDICKYENVQDGDFCAIVEVVSICDFSHGKKMDLTPLYERCAAPENDGACQHLSIEPEADNTVPAGTTGEQPKEYWMWLHYGWEESVDDGIRHAFEVSDPEDDYDDEVVEQSLRSELAPDEGGNFNFDWDITMLKLPESLVKRIQADVVKERGWK